MEPRSNPATGDPLCAKPRKDRRNSKPKVKTVYCGLIFHDLRRTFVTDAEEAGAGRHEIMKVTGHKTEAVYKRYAIENRERRQAAVNKIEVYRTERRPENRAKIGQTEILSRSPSQPVN